MSLPLRVLIVEDSSDDTALLLRELRRGGFEPTCQRVDTAAAMSGALDAEPWDIIISDYVMPQFSGTAALALMKERGLDLPFIIISGAISEDIAVAAMKAGAHDYVFKGNLTRLVPAIERELREAEVRRSERRARQIEQERNELKKAVEAQEKAMGVVSHELRTPLAAARVMAELLLEDGVRETAQLNYLVQGIHEEVLRMSGMVNDLLEVARLNSGAAKWNWAVVSVAKACTDALESARPLVDDQKIALASDVQPQDLKMRGDADAIRRIVLNLVSNAIKFTPSGSIHVSARATSDDDGHWVEIEVRDTGKGMSPQTTAKLGEAFALNSGLVGEGLTSGTGLGLAICKGIAAAHGGKISVASAPGRGTSVTVRLRPNLPEPVVEMCEDNVRAILAVA